MAAVESRVFVGLGGNLGDRLATLRSATESLRHGDAPQTWLTRVSSIYETRAVGPSHEPFLNAVVELATTLRPSQLIVALSGIESAHGRTRNQRWQARTLDLDIVVWLDDTGDAPRSRTVHSDSLSIPHPRAQQRDFVLQPLAELLGDTTAFGAVSARAALAALPAHARTILRRLPDELLMASA